jgi:hypothetical protein
MYINADWQNHLVVLKNKSLSIRFQQVVVQWLIAMFGIDYPAEATPDLLRQMIAAIVKKENIKGLSATYDSLAERYPLTVDAVAEAAKYAAGKLFFLSCNASCEYFDHICAERAMRHHRIVVRNALVALLVAPRTAATVAENKVVRAVFGEGTLQPVLRLTDAKFAPLVEAATNPSRTCIWETKALLAEGYRTVADGNTLDACEELLHFIGEPTHIPSYPRISLSLSEHFGISQNN